MFIPLLLLRGKSPEKTKQCVTEIFLEWVVAHRRDENSFYEWENFYFTKRVCIYLFLEFMYFSFRLLHTAHPNNFLLRSWQTSTHFHSRNWWFLIANTSTITVRILHWRKSKAPFYKSDKWLNQNDSYSNVLEGRVRHQASLRGICGEWIIKQNAYRRVSQYSCTLRKKNMFSIKEELSKKECGTRVRYEKYRQNFSRKIRK
jgi:hypothetical protein